jgi:hypothetical protein
MNVSFLSIFNNIVLVVLLMATAGHAQTTPFFCGDQDCIIALRLSCEEMIEQYHFQGSCCSMVPMPETRGCRLTVSNRGNCFWYPYCGECDTTDAGIGCNLIYETESEGTCPPSDYDPVTDGLNRTEEGVSCAPTIAPTFDPNAPTNPPINSSSPSLQFGVLSFVALAAAALLVIAC